jgi:DNA-directed RNA polymerase subunit RPC12/RpoP
MNFKTDMIYTCPDCSSRELEVDTVVYVCAKCDQEMEHEDILCMLDEKYDGICHSKCPHCDQDICLMANYVCTSDFAI